MTDRTILEHLNALNAETRNLYRIAARRYLTDHELAHLQTLWLEYHALCELLRANHSTDAIGEAHNARERHTLEATFFSSDAAVLRQGVN